MTKYPWNVGVSYVGKKTETKAKAVYDTKNVLSTFKIGKNAMLFSYHIINIVASLRRGICMLFDQDPGSPGKDLELYVTGG